MHPGLKYLILIFNYSSDVPVAPHMDNLSDNPSSNMSNIPRQPEVQAIGNMLLCLCSTLRGRSA